MAEPIGRDRSQSRSDSGPRSARQSTERTLVGHGRVEVSSAAGGSSARRGSPGDHDRMGTGIQPTLGARSVPPGRLRRAQCGRARRSAPPRVRHAENADARTIRESTPQGAAGIGRSRPDGPEVALSVPDRTPGRRVAAPVAHVRHRADAKAPIVDIQHEPTRRPDAEPRQSEQQLGEPE